MIETDQNGDGLPVQLLPQMKSIWLDEDQEAEKLYGVQAQQLMEEDEENDSLGLMMINSSKPVLQSKRCIDLPPLSKAAQVTGNAKSSTRSKKKVNSGNKLLSLFRGKEVEKRNFANKQISAPFDFQHISHAIENLEVERKNQQEKIQQQSPTRSANSKTKKSKHHEKSPVASPHKYQPKKEKTLSRAFVTESVKSPKLRNSPSFSRFSGMNSYSQMMTKRTPSNSSSYYSQRSSETVSTSRIVSTSTMASSVHEVTSPKHLVGLTNMEKKYNAKHYRGNSTDSEYSMENLKNYTFPTVLQETYEFNVEQEPATDEKSISVEELSNQIDEVKAKFGIEMKKKSLSSRSRSNSDSNVMTGTPQLEASWFAGTPTIRKSLDDDVLIYYLQPSSEDSPLRTLDNRQSILTESIA